MDQRKYDREMMEGRLPSSAPLANPYVPFQREDPPKYEPRKALARGTMFPGLDLPFMGVGNRRDMDDSPLGQLQVMGFAMHDLALYLDTHRDDKEAMALYRQYQKMYHDGMMAYSQKCTPLSHDQPVDHGSYSWLDDPWPWEQCKN